MTVDSPGGRWTYGLSEPLQRGGAQSLHRGADGQGAVCEAGGPSYGRLGNIKRNGETPNDSKWIICRMTVNSCSCENGMMIKDDQLMSLSYVFRTHV